MRPRQLYKHIETIYNHFDDFKSKMLIDNLLIIKRDNYYQCFIPITDNLKLQFKIQLNNQLHYEIINSETTESYKITEKIPQSFLNLFNPTLREFKIKMIMNETKDSTQTIFEHSI